MASKKKVKLIVLRPDGSKEEIEYEGELLKKLYELIGTDCVTRTEVKYEGKKRWVWLSDNGFAERKPVNPQIRPLAEDYWKVRCQDFVGVGVVELPA